VISETDLTDKSRDWNSPSKWQGEFLTSVRRRGVKESSIRVYAYMLNHVAKRLDLETVTRERLFKHLDEVQASRSQRHYRNLVVVTKAVLKHLKREELADEISLPKMPDAATEVKKKIIPPEERKKLIEKAPTLMDRLIFELLDETAGRRHEINSLTMKDIQFDQYGAILTLTGKTGTRMRRVYTAIPDLRAYLNNHPHRDDANAKLFPFKTDMTFYHHIVKVTKQVLGHQINPHRWRHTRATEDAKYFTDQEMMILNGWKRADVIRVYAHLSMRDVENKDLTLHGLKRREEILRPLTEIRVCPKCEAQNAPVAIYCHECGVTLSKVELTQELVNAMYEEIKKNPHLILRAMGIEPKHQGGDKQK
jgi:integrase